MQYETEEGERSEKQVGGKVTIGEGGVEIK